MARKLFVFATCFAACGPLLLAQCEISTEVRRLLDGPQFRQKMIESPPEREERNAAFQKALKEHPGDYFVLRAKLRGFEDRGEAAAWGREQRAANPDSLVYQMIEAEALVGSETPGAIRRMEALQQVHLDEPRIYLQIASAQSYGKYKDKGNVQKQLDGYRRLCPESIDGSFLSLTMQHGAPQQVSAVAVALRKRLEGETGPLQRNAWESLWKLEFNSHPIAEHPAVRKKVGEDLARLEAAGGEKSAAWMAFIRSGYQSVGDQEAVGRWADEIVAAHPHSSEARRILEERFRKEHPYPSTGDEATLNEWRRVALRTYREWLKEWPEEAIYLYEVESCLAGLPDTKAEEFTASVDAFLAAYRNNPEFTTSPPFEYRIAEGYVKHKVRLEQVRPMVDDAFKTAMDRQRRFEDDRMDEDSLKMTRNSADYLQMDRARVLVSLYAATKEPAKAREVLDGIHLADPGRQKSPMLALQAKVAEVEDHKPDALVLYRAALEARTGAKPSGKDALADDLQRLWKEMGGTDEGFTMLMRQPKAPESATDSRWEKPKNPLPSFTLTDLGGKTWKLTNLEGKALLINIWATWCGPCVAEHPEFQKLYDKLKDRPDVSILSFNVDDDLGKVAPYMTEHKYTFPAMPAKDVVDAVVPALAIPRNWLVNPKGKLEWEQIGFGGDAKWEEAMLAKLEEVARAK